MGIQTMPNAGSSSDVVLIEFLNSFVEKGCRKRSNLDMVLIESLNSFVEKGGRKCAECGVEFGGGFD